jgi:acyl carrier protein
MEELKNELKKYIIEELNLEDITPEEIENDAPLFVEGLGLDSIDALELVVILEEYYGVIIKDETLGKEVLYSIDTMAAHIEKVRSEQKN